ncbi:MAG: class I SAM-dependent methyltransferase [Pseudomonadota bacterium]
MHSEYNANAWGHESILNFFDKKRLTTQHIYPSEWFFLKDKIKDDISLLDIGCAKGGMANVLAENLANFNYVGVDINEQMIDAAKQRYPQHIFYQITEEDYSVLQGKQYDLVLCLGILHLHESWRNTIKEAWRHTRKCLILDLRETHLASIEDKKQAYFKMDFDNISNPTSNYILPYNIINTAEALRTIHEVCEDAAHIAHYGYTQALSGLAVSPIKKIMANVYCIER